MTGYFLCSLSASPKSRGFLKNQSNPSLLASSMSESFSWLGKMATASSQKGLFFCYDTPIELKNSSATSSSCNSVLSLIQRQGTCFERASIFVQRSMALSLLLSLNASCTYQIVRIKNTKPILAERDQSLLLSGKGRLLK